MDSVRIKVKEKDYPVVFGYGVSAKLGRHWGLTGIIPLFQKAMGIMGINEDTGTDVTLSESEGSVNGLNEIKIAESILQFDNLELLADILSFGIAQGLEVNVDQLPFDRDTLLKSMLEDLTVTTQVYMAFIMTMPRPKSPVSSSAVENKGVKNEKKRKPRPSAKKG